MKKTIMLANDISFDDLKLSLIDIDDYEAYFKIYSDKNNLKYLDLIPFDNSFEAKEMIIKLYFNEEYESYSYKIIKNNVIVGFIDIFNIQNSECEISYILDFNYQNQNIMYKSLNLVLNSLKEVEIKRVCAKILEGNLKSINLCKRLGFELVDKLDKILCYKKELGGMYEY